jgi:hypothetical protein
LQGVATFSGVTPTVVGNYTLTASAPGMQSITTAPFAVSAGAASQLAFQAQPTDTVAGQNVPDILVAVEDAFGNLVTDSTSPVDLTVTGPANPTAGPSGAGAVNGVATLSGLVLDKTGSYTLTVGSTGLTPATSASFNITPAAASQMVFASLPTGTTAGEVLTGPVVDILDQFGNLATNANVSVSLSVSGPGNFSAGNTTVQASGGVATFNGLILPTSGNYTFSASASGLPDTTSPVATINPGAGNHLTFVGLPPSGTAGQTLPNIQVDVVDAFGNVDTSNNTTVTLAVSGSGTGTTSVQALNGVATFSGLVLPTPGSYVFSASAPGLATITSGKIVANGTATSGGTTANNSSGGTPTTAGTTGSTGSTTVPLSTTSTSTSTNTSTASVVQFVSAPSIAHVGKAVTVRVRVLTSDHKPGKAGTVVTLKIVAGHRTIIKHARTGKNGIATFSGLKLTPAHYTLQASATGVSKPVQHGLVVLMSR